MEQSQAAVGFGVGARAQTPKFWSFESSSQRLVPEQGGDGPLPRLQIIGDIPGSRIRERREHAR